MDLTKIVFPQELNEVLSVSELTQQVKQCFNLIPETWVRGEIGSLRWQTSGHLYLTLKDAYSQLSVVFFKSQADKIPCQMIREGQLVVILGRLKVYEVRGNYQLVAQTLLSAGQGDIQMALEQLKKKLAAEGLFDSNRKKPIPLVPKTIGIITSKNGAALADFINILQRKGWRGRLLVLPTQVQGKEAIAGICKQLRWVQKTKAVELVILARGGGSTEDLWIFNDESLARQLAVCSIPTISAIGHAIDQTLCDLVADWQAETPSVAAGRIINSQMDATEELKECAQRLDFYLRTFRALKSKILEQFSWKLSLNTPHKRYPTQKQKFEELVHRLHQKLQLQYQMLLGSYQNIASYFNLLNLRKIFRQNQQALDHTAEQFKRSFLALFQKKQLQIWSVKEQLQKLDIEFTLKRGFMLLQDTQKRPLKTLTALLKQQEILIRAQDGEQYFNIFPCRAVPCTHKELI